MDALWWMLCAGLLDDQTFLDGQVHVNAVFQRGKHCSGLTMVGAAPD